VRRADLSALVPTGAARQGIERVPAYPPAVLAMVHDGDLDAGGAFLAWQLAQLPGRLRPRERDALLVLTARLLAAERAGSTRLALAEADKRLLAGIPEVVGDEHAHAPLIVDGDYLYSQRSHGCEARVAKALAQRSARGSHLGEAAVREAVDQVARASQPVPSDEQRQAVVAALSRGVGAISGGPGTGKTTTAITLVRTLVRLGVPANSIALCAPTGKAASRLEEDLRARLGQLAERAPADQSLLSDGPKAQTLHRLLGLRSGYTLAAASDTLPFRAVVVDESSMIDLVLMDRLLAALADTTLLVLLGDADQLPSVSSGAVFRDLGSLGTRLGHGFRTGGMQSLAELARAVQAGQVATCTSLFAVRDRPDRLVGQGAERLGAEHRDELLRRYHRSVFRAPEVLALLEPAFALEGNDDDGDGGGDGQSLNRQDQDRLDALARALGRSRVLAVTQERPTGVERSNAFLHELHGGGATFLPGEPVLMSRNDYPRQLWNGDQGIAVRTRHPRRGHAVHVAFRNRQGWLLVDPRLLGSALVLGYALSVHKAQGSELDAVTLLLPELPCPLLTRELLYTAVSRARTSVVVCGTLAALEAGVSTAQVRSTGIVQRLATLGVP
jgi:exodeoxyribonuclease V alpha subunit